MNKQKRQGGIQNHNHVTQLPINQCAWEIQVMETSLNLAPVCFIFDTKKLILFTAIFQTLLASI